MVTLALSVMLLSSQGTKPNEYNEKYLCDLYAGAQCYATSCQKDGKQRCEQVSKPCKAASRKTPVTKDRAERTAACAKAILQSKCGSPAPSECSGVTGY
jgi:hypothetical protein